MKSMKFAMVNNKVYFYNLLRNLLEFFEFIDHIDPARLGLILFQTSQLYIVFEGLLSSLLLYISKPGME